LGGDRWEKPFAFDKLSLAAISALSEMQEKKRGQSSWGFECDEVIHSILDVMYANAPYTVIQRAMHIHPTVSELIPTMLGQLKPLE
jgi:hypothetical protein